MSVFKSSVFKSSVFKTFVQPQPEFVGGSGVVDYREQELLAERRLIQNNNNALLLFLS